MAMFLNQLILKFNIWKKVRRKDEKLYKMNIFSSFYMEKWKTGKLEKRKEN